MSDVGAANKIDVEAANKIIENMSSQIDLLTTLSVAICAGIVALFINIALHNYCKENNKLFFNWWGLLFVAFLFQGFSILSGYFAYGAITNAYPIILDLTLDAKKTLFEHSFRNDNLIENLVMAQFSIFLVGILVVFLFLVLNCKLLKKEVEKSSREVENEN